MNPHVGLLFIDFEARQAHARERHARRSSRPTAVEPAYPQAQFVVRVSVREVFPNCPRYIHKYQLVERSKFVPHAGVDTPVPAWKRYEWAKDVLPAGDPAERERVTAVSRPSRPASRPTPCTSRPRSTSLPGKILQGRHSSPSLPVSCRQFEHMRARLVLRHLVRVDLLRVVHVAHRDGERILLVEMRRRALRRGVRAPGRRPAARRVLPKRSSERYDDRSGGRS